MAAPVMTFAAAGNVRASASLAAAANATVALDASTKVEMQVAVKLTNGATIAGTHGLQIDLLPGYGSTVAYATIPAVSVTIGSTLAASGTESTVIFLPTGKYQLKITNLDAANAVTVEATSVTIDSYS
jgi:hypothetical protein